MSRLIVSLLMLPALLGVDTAASERIRAEDIDAVFANWLKAMKTRDAELLSSVLHDQWLYAGTGDGSTTSKSANIQHLKQADYTITKVDFSDMNYRYFDDIAIVTGREVLHIQNENGEISQVNLRFTDVFQKKNGEVKALSTHSSPITK